MPLPRKPILKQELVYIEGQEEPVLMTVDVASAPGGSWADRRHERMKDAHEARLKREREERAAYGVDTAAVMKKQREKRAKAARHRKG